MCYTVGESDQPFHHIERQVILLISHGKEVKVFAGNANIPLAESISMFLHKPLGKAEIKRFADGECSVSIYEPVRGMTAERKE